MSAPSPARTDFGRDLVFNPQDFERVREMIHRLSGIALSDSKYEMVYSRLARRIRSLGLSDFRSYLDLIEQRGGAEEAEVFINALTTNLTAFFREAYHFPVLAQHLRELDGPARIWCAAASSGEEPYSIAITLLETLGSVAPGTKVLASDIDTAILAQAAEGIYPLDRVKKLSIERLRRFFLKGSGASEGLVKVRQELRDLVHFQHLNLTSPSWALDGPFDAIFCRNVMIYFDKPTQAAIVGRMLPLLKPNGLIFAGHSENFQYLSADLRSCGQTVYRWKSPAHSAAVQSSRTRNRIASA